MSRTLILACLCMLFVTSLMAQSLLTAETERLREDGFAALYSLDYEKAKVSFEQITTMEPRNPAGYVYLAGAVWLEHLSSLRRLQTQLYNRNNAFFLQSKDRVNPEVERLFYSYISKGMVRAQARLQLDPRDIAGLYFLGTAHAAVAGYEATVKRAFLSSLKNGSKAVDFHRKVLKLDPGFVDANLTIGMYDYVVGTLPFAVKILMLLGGVHGSRKDGLLELEKVRSEGKYAKDEAAVILLVLYDREKQWQRSLQILQELGKRYPDNFVFDLESAAMLAKLLHFRESSERYEALLKNEKAMEYMPDVIHFYYAESLFATRSWQKAHDHYVAARRSSDKTSVPMISLTHLRAGQCLNAMQQDEEAQVEYSFVLKQPNVLDSHETAKKYLKKPFRP